ncbi:MAG: lipoprotein [Gammaproteobacteria bacterium]|nr:lipoprotein [Gammaproteobacteria bacterium]
MRICWAQWVFIAVIAVLGLAQMLSACGNKGPLYLPEETAQTADSATDKESLKDKTAAEDTE